MSSLAWAVRRELLVADLLVVLGVARSFELENGGLRWLTIVVLMYLVACMHVFAMVDGGRGLEAPLGAARMIKWIANLSLALGGWVIVQVLIAPRFGGGINYEPPRYLGVEVGDIVLFAGLAALLVGWALVRRIARGEPEPEANDEFWWSRTQARTRLRLPTRGWILTRGAARFADLVIAGLLVWPLVAPSMFDPMWGAATPSVLGVPPLLLTYVGGFGLAIGGRVWMERILRGDREPEAHDEFWWSRT